MATDPIVEMENVVAGYGAMTILNGTTFKIAPRAITTVIGPNGAGKSTVFKTIFGLLRPRSRRRAGQWQGRFPLVAAAVASRGRLLHPAGTQYFSGALGPAQHRARRRLRRPRNHRHPRQARRRARQVPRRFAAKADRQASTLSGGEQKQLEIVRGLLLDPKLILIDEPSIGLSPLMVQETFALLTELRDRGASILMIEQNARSALQMSDFGLVLELGQTRMHDKASAILNDPRVAQLFLGGVVEG